MKVHHISAEFLSIEQLQEVVFGGYQIELSEDSKLKIQKCRDYLDQKMASADAPIYGINTGFGSLYSESISDEDLCQLQENLVMSHSCGMGDEVPHEIVRLMLFLKAQGLSYGHSGVHLATVQRLLDFLNKGVYPVIYQQGSLGASGDLSPLANMSLALLGKGEVDFQGERQPAATVLDHFNWSPIVLQSKEGLALLNGTQFMSAYGSWTLLKALHLSEMADLVGSVSLEAYDGRVEPFRQNVHAIRNHKGQQDTAANIWKYLEGSELIQQEKIHVQDPYSFRCMPQVHGATKDALLHIKGVFENEINAVTDNPTIFPDEDQIVSAGNFHGQPLAINLDYLAIVMAELGSISERRTYKLIGGQRGLPPFLVANPGLNSGFMIPQYTAASIVSQNKQLCTPASVDTIHSSNGQEDHVSMGANAATKCYLVVNNVEKIIGIELFNGVQGLQFRKPLKSSETIEKLADEFLKVVPFVEDDIVMHVQMKKAVNFVSTYSIE
ncbi:MAG: histidine ammonia-lyase [Flavobacteriales bacterium]|nr:histidine ammonia-lyase [Flavobacteriales bacterium]